MKSISTYAGLFYIPENESAEVWQNWELPHRDFMLSQLNADSVMLDVGANIGYFSVHASLKSSKVYAVEPNPLVFEILEQNSKILGRENIIPLNVALSNYDGENDFYYRDGAHGDGRLYDVRKNNDGNNYCVKKVPVFSVSTFAKKWDTKIDFIKMDCEGSEYEILQDEYFKTHNTTIMLETHLPMIEGRGLDVNFFCKYLFESFRCFDMHGYDLKEVPSRAIILLKGKQ